MKLISVLLSVFFLLACNNESVSSNDSAEVSINQASEQSNTSSIQATQVNTQGVDLNAFLNDDKICSIVSESQLKSLFNVPEKITTEFEKNGAAVNCRYSWRYDSLEARQEATGWGSSFDFGRQIIYNKRTISNEAKLVISLMPYDKSAAEFLPAILSRTEIETVVESDLMRLKNQMALSGSRNKEVEIRLDKMADSRKSDLIQRNQQNIIINDVGDAAYWNHSGVGGLHVLVGQVEIFISPFIANNAGADVIIAINLLAKIVE